MKKHPRILAFTGATLALLALCAASKDSAWLLLLYGYMLIIRVISLMTIQRLTSRGNTTVEIKQVRQHP